MDYDQELEKQYHPENFHDHECQEQEDGCPCQRISSPFDIDLERLFGFQK